MSKHQNLIHISILTLLFIFLILLVSACDTQSRGFVLPQGNAEQGKINFIALACNECQSVVNSVEKIEDGNLEIHYKLGGPVTRVKTYGDLVTSIINPSHKISGYYRSELNSDPEGKSKMRIYNDIMTIQQLIDLAAYLETSYDVVRPQVAPIYGP